MASFKSFKYFKETPLDQGEEVEKLKDLYRGNTDLEKIREVLFAYAKKYPTPETENFNLRAYIGEKTGKYRTAIMITTEHSLFDEEMVKDLGFANPEEFKHLYEINKRVSTVVKVARPSEQPSEQHPAGLRGLDGIKCNKKEFENWQKVKDKPKLKRFLCPVIDTSARITGNDNNFTFIQMPLCVTDLDLIDEKAKETFGDYTKTVNENLITFFSWLQTPNAYKEKISNHFDQISFQQQTNLVDLQQLYSSLWLQDIHPKNCGVYHGRFLILDYAGIPR